jgi:hypothetical protein
VLCDVGYTKNVLDGLQATGFKLPASVPAYSYGPYPLGLSGVKSDQHHLARIPVSVTKPSIVYIETGSSFIADSLTMGVDVSLDSSEPRLMVGEQKGETRRKL